MDEDGKDEAVESVTGAGVEDGRKSVWGIMGETVETGGKKFGSENDKSESNWENVEYNE